MLDSGEAIHRFSAVHSAGTYADSRLTHVSPSRELNKFRVNLRSNFIHKSFHSRFTSFSFDIEN